MSVPYAPTIVYPNGGEILTTGLATISWSSPLPSSDDGRAVTYELYFTDDFDHTNEPDWQQIASLPSAASSFEWRFGKTIRSEKCRIAIRSKNTRGERSVFSISAANFTISRKKLTTPTFISPVNGGRYDKYIEVVMDDRGLLGTFAQRAFYAVYYSSASLGIPPTLLQYNIPVGDGSFVWDITDFEPANDYTLQVFLKDDGGNLSDSAYVKGISIAHEGFFIVDTIPPVGAVAINFNSDTKRQESFTRKQDVTVHVVAYDDATDVHAMEFTDGETASKPDSLANVKRFTLSSTEEVKSVGLLLQDYGGNRNSDPNKLARLYHVSVELDETEIADIAADPSSETVWAVTRGESKRLCKITDFPSLLVSFEDNPTAVSVFQSSPYVATNSDENKASLYRYDGTDTDLVRAFTEEDSTVNAMLVHDSKLFLGMESGRVYTYDGLTFQLVDEMASPIKSLYTDESLLYMVLKNDLSIYIFNGTTFFSTDA